MADTTDPVRVPQTSGADEPPAPGPIISDTLIVPPPPDAVAADDPSAPSDSPLGVNLGAGMPQAVPPVTKPDEHPDMPSEPPPEAGELTAVNGDVPVPAELKKSSADAIAAAPPEPPPPSGPDQTPKPKKKNVGTGLLIALLVLLVALPVGVIFISQQQSLFDTRNRAANLYPSQSCTETSDCMKGEVCAPVPRSTSKMCRAVTDPTGPCATNGTCANGYICNTSTNTCQVTQCIDNTDCGLGEICRAAPRSVSKICAPMTDPTGPCTTVGTCANGYTCNTTTNTCILTPGCKTAADCNIGEICRPVPRSTTMMCAPMTDPTGPCTTVGTCANGYKCNTMKNICEPVTSPTGGIICKTADKPYCAPPSTAVCLTTGKWTCQAAPTVTPTYCNMWDSCSSLGASCKTPVKNNPLCCVKQVSGTSVWAPNTWGTCPSSVTCPWPLTNGKCCPTGKDKCGTLGGYVCIEDPYASECVVWDKSCPAGSQNYYKAVEWSSDFEYIKNKYCSGGTPKPSNPPGTSTPHLTQPPVAGQCQDIRAYKGNTLLDAAGLKALKPGDVVVFTVRGSQNPSKARFRINGSAWAETTKKKNQDEYASEDYTIPAGVVNFTIAAEVFVDNTWK